MFSSSLSRKVRSVASPGRKHSSSCQSFTNTCLNVTFDRRPIWRSPWQPTSIEMIPLCFSSTRSQMILLLKNWTGSHWVVATMWAQNAALSQSLLRLWGRGFTRLPRYLLPDIPPAQPSMLAEWKAAAASRCSSLYRTVQNWWEVWVTSAAVWSKYRWGCLLTCSRRTLQIRRCLKDL